MKILFLHGLESLPGGSKVEYLRGLGHDVLNPLLPKDDFEESVSIAQEQVDLESPDLIIGSSRGGAVAMAVDPGRARLILIAPAWKHFDVPPSAPANTDVLHCTTDDIVLFKDSQKLQGANLVPCGDDHRMADDNALAALGRAVGGNLQTEALLRGWIRQLLTESAEEAAKIMRLWDHEEWDQARELAFLMGPEVSQHPDLKIWALVDGETGQILVDELNYDQAMDPMYQAFQVFNSGYTVTTDETEDNPWGHVAGGASARTHPIPQDKLDNAVEVLRQEAMKVNVVKVDEENFHIWTMLEDL